MRATIAATAISSGIISPKVAKVKMVVAISITSYAGFNSKNVSKKNPGWRSGPAGKKALNLVPTLTSLVTS